MAKSVALACALVFTVASDLRAQMYAEAQKLFGGRWAPWRPVIAKHWQAFLSGDISRPEAIARIAREIA